MHGLYQERRYQLFYVVGPELLLFFCSLTILTQFPPSPFCSGPIYHELEPGEIEEILAGIAAAPPIPPRVRPPKPRDPVYERIDSVRQTMHRKLTLKLSASSQVVTRVSVDGAYIISKCCF